MNDSDDMTIVIEKLAQLVENMSTENNTVSLGCYFLSGQIVIYFLDGRFAFNR